MNFEDDPRGIFVNDRAYFGLPPAAQRALKSGQLTPLEARHLLRVRSFRALEVAVARLAGRMT